MLGNSTKPGGSSWGCWSTQGEDYVTPPEAKDWRAVNGVGQLPVIQVYSRESGAAASAPPTAQTSVLYTS